jgi:hypothetical protein
VATTTRVGPTNTGVVEQVVRQYETSAMSWPASAMSITMEGFAIRMRKFPWDVFPNVREPWKSSVVAPVLGSYTTFVTGKLNTPFAAFSVAGAPASRACMRPN